MKNRWTHWVVQQLTMEYSFDLDLRFYDLLNTRTTRMMERIPGA